MRGVHGRRHFVTLAMLDGVCAAFTGPAKDTAIRGIVPSGQLHAAYAQEEARTHAAGLIGPPLGGLLYGLGRAVPFAVDALTFLAATFFYALAKVPRHPGDRPHPSARQDGSARQDDGEQRPARPSMRRQAGEAVAWLWRRRWAVRRPS
ncbi:MFS transporter [Planobispora siamensis]|uniref:Major Facilitator Superfamily protein n=1 Tax=Planobispora siamensis TaxID=936338 RepID=A0A8J3WQX3_9ACTN|nr:MFS transporter [Planobispora siamensis]GIH97427.1 hypothetical protein Psi01_80570 [Planobispora siamensis]